MQKDFFSSSSPPLLQNVCLRQLIFWSDLSVSVLMTKYVFSNVAVLNVCYRNWGMLSLYSLAKASEVEVDPILAISLLNLAKLMQSGLQLWVPPFTSTVMTKNLFLHPRVMLSLNSWCINWAYLRTLELHHISGYCVISSFLVLRLCLWSDYNACWL